MAIAFDYNFYLEQKLAQLQGLEGYEDYTNTAQVVAAFEEAGLTVKEHYELYGAGEGLNPSADFDTNAYLEAKLEQLQSLGGYEDIQTTDDVLEAFQEAGLSPLEHYNQYGINEGLEATSATASALTNALETLQGAEQAKEDFLTASASNELVQEELTDVDGLPAVVDAENPTTAEVEAAIKQADTDISAALTTARSLNSDRVLDAKLADAQDAVTAYEAKIAEVDGLEQAIAAKSAATAEVDAATEAQTEADADLAGEVVTFDQKNGGTTTITYLDADGTVTTDFSEVASITDGTDVLFTVNNGNLTSTAADGTKGVAALQSAVQAKLDAEIALAEANEADTAADAELAAITDFSDSELTEADGTAVYNQLDSLEGDVETAQGDVDDRAELVSDAQEIGALADQLEAADKAITDARDTLTDDEADGGFGVNLVDLGGTGTADDDLFVFSAGADTSTSQFGAAGEDKIYIGDSFTRVDLASDADFAEEQGDASTLEVFFQQDGANAVLTFEDKAFAGSGSSDTVDLTEVTLTGVSVDDLSIDNGYITIA